MSTNILSIKSDYLCTGRAATALYLIAQVENLKGKKVLFPCNVCYAAIFPFLYAGCIPVFCDTDLKSGNITAQSLAAHKDCSAVVVPHMYGNPVKDIFEIRNICTSAGILLIEDCASAMGAEISGMPCGSFGDYTIFSTGYSKTIDIGFGGILLSDRDLSSARELVASLPPKTEQSEIDEAFFGKLYRLIRNDPAQKLSPFIWRGLRNELKHLFVYSISAEDARTIINSLDSLDNIIKQRRQETDLYSKLLNSVKCLEPYEFADGAVPWRYCVFTDTDSKKDIICGLLKLNLPVSDWYPVVTGIFGEDPGNYPNAAAFEKRILNFPLMSGEALIQNVCNAINSITNIEKRI